MAGLTNSDLLKITRNAYKRVHDKTKAKRIDVKKRVWLQILESMREESGFEGGAIKYAVQLSFSDPGTTWTGDDEIEAFDPDFSLNLEYGYFNFTTAVTIKHDMLTQLGFTVIPNGDGSLEDRAMGKDMAFKIQNYIKNLVIGFSDNHDRYLERLLMRSGAASTKDPVGLFGILTQDATTGNVGGLSRATYTQLRHITDTGLSGGAAGDFRAKFTTAVRSAELYSHPNGIGGNGIDYYMAGKTFIDTYTSWADTNLYRVTRTMNERPKIDFSIPDNTVFWDNTPIFHCPTMDDLDSVDTFSPTLAKSCVGISKPSWHFKSLTGKYKKMTSPADPPKQRVSREDIDTTAHIACDAPASNVLLGVD